MSLSSTMWTSVSGLLGHGKKMNTIGNNIANINTVGFKGQRMDFADFVYQNTNSLAGATQNGFGVQVGAIMGNFSQGTFESSTEATDLAINGSGFFQVQKIGSDEEYYTRAGNFRFNAEGYLTDPNGFALQGWRVDNDGGVQQAAGGNVILTDENTSSSAIIGSGVPTDVKLDTFSIFPQQTTHMDFRVNLPQDGADSAKNSENPFAGLFSVWNGTYPPDTANTPAIAQSSYAAQTTLEVFDEAGSKHVVTVYFDKVNSDDFQGGNSGDDVWEYIVTMDPAEDRRQFYDETIGEMVNVNTTSSGGLLMSGTLTFDSAGALQNQTAYTWGGSQTPESNPASYQELPDPAGGLTPKQVLNLDPSDMFNWQPAPVSSNGYPMVVPNFGGIMDAQTSGTENGARYNIEINFGLNASNLSQPWQNNASLAEMNVSPYTFNTEYKSNDDTFGPEYLLLKSLDPADPNPYDPTQDQKWDIDSGRYVTGGASRAPFDALGADGLALFNAIQGNTASAITITDYTVDPAVPDTAINDNQYRRAIELYDIEEVVLLAGSISAGGGGVPPHPPLDVTVNLVTGAVAPIVDTTPPTVVTLDLTDATTLETVSNSIQNEMQTASPRNLYLFSPASPSNANFLAEFTEPAIVEASASTSLDGPFSAANGQNGYTFGDLTSWEFDQHGIMYGVYSNGVELPLWQVTMYDFVSPQGLRREGNNLFSQTRDSGEAKSGPAGTSGLGTVTGYHLEQSNVDMSTEFVYMIATQRGFQANSKSITTVDQMLETVIGMKR